MKSQTSLRSIRQAFRSSLDRRLRILSLERLENIEATNSLFCIASPIVGLSSVGLLAEPMGVDYGGSATFAGYSGGATNRPACRLSQMT